MTAAVGMNDSFEVQFQNEYQRYSAALQKGELLGPTDEELITLLANRSPVEERIKHLHEAVAAGEAFRDETKVAMAQCVGEVETLRGAHRQTFRMYRGSVHHYRAVSIACDKLMHVSSFSYDHFVQDHRENEIRIQ